MIQDSIRWFFNFLCSFYLFYKLLNLKNPKILQKISFFIIFLIDSFLFCFLEANSFIFIFPTIILFNTFILSRFTQKTISLSLVTLVISEGIHYILFLLAALLTALVIAPFFYGRYDLPYVAIKQKSNQEKGDEEKEELHVRNGIIKADYGNNEQKKTA